MRVRDFTLGSCEIAVFVANVFVLICGRVQNLNVGSQIFLPICFAEVCKSRECLANVYPVG